LTNWENEARKRGTTIGGGIPGMKPVSHFGRQLAVFRRGRVEGEGRVEFR
jgi:hypothetical protein